MEELKVIKQALDIATQKRSIFNARCCITIPSFTTIRG